VVLDAKLARRSRDPIGVRKMTVLTTFLESRRKHYQIWYSQVEKFELPETQFERTVRKKPENGRKRHCNWM